MYGIIYIERRDIMRLSFKLDINLSHKQVNIVNDLAWHLSKLYNIVNYKVLNDIDVKPIYTKLEKLFKSNWHCDYLHSHNRQQLLKQLSRDWNSYFTSLKDYRNNSEKYKAQPGIPRYKNLNKSPAEIVFTQMGIRIREGRILLSLSKKIQSIYQVKCLNLQLPTEVEGLINMDRIQQIKIKYDKLSHRWYLLLIYKIETVDKAEGNNIMSIDLGLNNLATITFKDNVVNYIIDGKTIKSKNSYFNKEITRLQSIIMKQTESKYFNDSEKLKRIRIKRRNYIANYLHKASFRIVKLAREYNVSTIVIGDIKDIKQKMKYNKSFVQIPVQRLVKLIEYKAKVFGIEVIKIKESYTSGCSALDLEEVNKDNYDKSRRITRGLFSANTGIMINADVNGSLNILRKYKKECIPELVKQARDNGVVFPPSRLRVA